MYINTNNFIHLCLCNSWFDFYILHSIFNQRKTIHKYSTSLLLVWLENNAHYYIPSNILLYDKETIRCITATQIHIQSNIKDFKESH